MAAKRPSWATWTGVAVGVILLVAAVVLGNEWRGGKSTRQLAAPAAALSHVHGMGVNPADGHLYVATHHGVVRVSDAEATLVGESRQDTMGFAVVGPDHFLASGHPAPGQSGPAHLGLIESTDAGRTWRNVALAGQADFHAMSIVGDVVYGLDSTTGSLLASSDRREWQARSRIEAYDLAVDPGQPDTVLATTEQGLQRSIDGGRTWAPAGGPTVLLLDWSARDRLHAVGIDGQLLRSADGGKTWAPTSGRVPAVPAAFTTHGGTLFVASRDGQVLRSTDSGSTWQPMDTTLS